MMDWIKSFWNGLVEEITLKSKYGKELGTDTFRRWIGAVMVFAIFYWCVHHFDEYAIWQDNWFYEHFGWKKSTIPSAGKIAWHRMVAAGMAGIGILASTGEFGISLYRRIRARRAASRLQNTGKTDVS